MPLRTDGDVRQKNLNLPKQILEQLADTRERMRKPSGQFVSESDLVQAGLLILFKLTDQQKVDALEMSARYVWERARENLRQVGTASDAAQVVASASKHETGHTENRLKRRGGA